MFDGAPAERISIKPGQVVELVINGSRLHFAVTGPIDPGGIEILLRPGEPETTLGDVRVLGELEEDS